MLLLATTSIVNIAHVITFAHNSEGGFVIDCAESRTVNLLSQLFLMILARGLKRDEDWGGV